jgi:serine/threonine protein phosphatase 1
MHKKFAIGDIHGGYKALKQCLERSKFDKENDTLIILGDICDGWPFVKECIEEVMSIKNLIFIIGNHDAWVLHWLKTGDAKPIWLHQGGWNSFNSLIGCSKADKEKYIKFFEEAPFYYIKDNKLFVHGGINHQQKIENWDRDEVMWDRELMQYAYKLYMQKKEKNLSKFDEIFIGHTSTEFFKYLTPMKFCNVWCLDQGGGWSGKLSIMDVDTHEYWQSDFVHELYPEIKGRK